MDLQEISDRIELRALVDEYARAIDLREPDRLVGLFTQDGYFGVFAPGETVAHAAFQGSAELRELMGMLSSYGPTMHLMLNHYIDDLAPDRDHATGVVYALARHLVERDGAIKNLEMSVRYEDRYVRTDLGWKIAHRRIVREWNELLPVLDGQLVF